MIRYPSSRKPESYATHAFGRGNFHKGRELGNYAGTLIAPSWKLGGPPECPNSSAKLEAWRDSRKPEAYATLG